MARKVYELALVLAGKIDSSFGGAFSSAGEKLQRMNRTISALRAEMRQLEKAQKAGKITAEEYASAHAKLAQQLEETERAQKRLATAVRINEKVASFRQAMRGRLLDTVEYALTLGASVRAAIQFESAMADVRKVVDFETPEQFKAMGKDIVQLSKRIPMAASELAQIVAAGGQAGIAREELLGFAEAAAKMGVAFDITAEEAGQTMAEWRSAFNMTQEQVNILADQINYLGNTTAASAPKIAEVVRRIGPLGEVGGAAAAQIAALGATMVSAGIQEEVAATGIKNLILGLVAGESATKGQAAAFKRLGLDAVEMAKLMQKDAQGAILKVLEAIKRLPKHEQASMLDELFGKESIGPISVLLTRLDALKENFSKVGDATKYAGSMQAEFEARSATTENRLQLLRNQMTALGISVGEILLPPLNTLAGRLAGIIERVQELAGRYPSLTNAIVIGTAALMGLSIAFWAVGYAASIIATPFTTLYMLATRFGIVSGIATVATKTWAAAQWLLNAAWAASPIGVMIAGVGALIGIGYLLYRNWDKIREFFVNLWNGPLAALDRFAKKVYEKLGKVLRWFGLGGEASPKAGTTGGFGGFRAIEGHAAGGIFDKPHMAWIAEKGPEAVVPLDGSSRAVSLWAQAGEILGVRPTSAPQIVYSPIYNVYGGGDVEEAVRRAAKQAEDDFAARMRALLHQERRLSYA
ncbi:MAG: phage tail tape measure protein [Firmicutes bacterium]|nr:phage tail tape measure protein [Bacillota bacterium]